jgi:hypothetical protein
LRGVRWLALVIVALACSGCVTTKAQWDPAAYRAAVESGDDTEIGRQARAVAREQALVGLTRKQVHALMGKPDWEPRGKYSEGYPAGWANESMVFDDENSLTVLYDRAWRVVRVEYSPG